MQLIHTLNIQNHLIWVWMSHRKQVNDTIRGVTEVSERWEGSPWNTSCSFRCCASHFSTVLEQHTPIVKVKCSTAVCLSAAQISYHTSSHISLTTVRLGTLPLILKMSQDCSISSWLMGLKGFNNFSVCLLIIGSTRESFMLSLACILSLLSPHN